MTLTLLTAYNAPYLAALTFVLLTGIAELIALLCGHSSLQLWIHLIYRRV